MQRHAFSLVELSIVLVILGLLTGGILGGQSLIRAAELRSISTEQARYMDDGKPGQGSVLVITPGNLPNCADSTSVATAAYVLSNSGTTCGMIFKTGF